MLIDPCYAKPLAQLSEAAWVKRANQIANSGGTHLLLAPLNVADPVAWEQAVARRQEALDRRGLRLLVFAGEIVTAPETIVPDFFERVLYSDLNRTYLYLDGRGPLDTEAMRQLIFASLSRDITPVLIAPEQAQADDALLSGWQSEGVALLVAAESLLGENGDSAEQTAWRWLEHERVATIGSVDAADWAHYPAALRQIASRFGHSYHDDLLINGKALLNGESLITHFH